mmetsp:Transcript_50296/g.83487  ORF Transcript_50296/g.83487 Transcript_50296/m.83487 type:complete len:284 (+) Transcript_50296:173-1024(+)|eukprot:CAMPEP_0184653088 /NCGR_PEP_ID=MMETSP0308-20130426/10821_1 /TAXON_ID=38269 /ORGANISM="Gloeochaete witrockiana, Strain SAG 46.84" /LENGTH=283 /DNA_ID=CAMNT_0027088369 /DNA_START=132 /DNA_END=983 /DNA_ORIENTATION=-
MELRSRKRSQSLSSADASELPSREVPNATSEGRAAPKRRRVQRSVEVENIPPVLAAEQVTEVAITPLDLAKSSAKPFDLENTSQQTPKKGGDNEDENVCVICLDALKGRSLFTTACGHQFHFSCIRDALSNANESCPLCRTSFGQMTPPSVFAKRRPLHPPSALPRQFVSRMPAGPSSSEARATIHDWVFDYATKKVHGVTAEVTDEYAQNVAGGANDGMIQTSPIVFAEGRKLTTYSSSVYMLGEINPEFRARLGANFDPENPLSTLTLFNVDDEMRLFADD